MVKRPGRLAKQRHKLHQRTMMHIILHLIVFALGTACGVVLMGLLAMSEDQAELYDFMNPERRN
jgi:Na+-transporting methylmalonyl-CoA/oxaloacetate decarboxylase beta subunit